jgi:glycosyltransferase involved in cell wall biosynthesis
LTGIACAAVTSQARIRPFRKEANNLQIKENDPSVTLSTSSVGINLQNDSPAITDKTILCLATQEWDAHWTPVQQIMLRLAAKNRIIYCEPFHPPLAWLKKSNRQLKGTRADQRSSLREVKKNLLVYRPQSVYLPRNMKSTAAAHWNARVYKREIANLLRLLGVQRPWLWAFFAQSLSVLELEFEHVIYDCVDDWPSFFPHPAEHQFITRVDEQLCRRAEIVFVGSHPLYEKKANLNQRTFVVNHAADIEHFQKASREDTTVPSDLQTVPRPRIGFVGMMDSLRFDDELIGRLAEDSRLQIVLLGGCLGDVRDRIPKKTNIHLMGMKPVSELPSYLKGMDVCIMPYKINETTKYIYPLKLHEYLATGKPVVAMAVPAVEEFRDLLYVARNPAQFVELVYLALTEHAPAKRLRRQECARQHTWESHLAEKARLIHENVNSRPSSPGHEQFS